MSSKTDTWMPLYIGEYLADTQHLSTLEHGAYLLLLMCYWRKKGPLPDDDVKLARMAGLSLKQWKAIRSNIVELFRQVDGQLVSKRSEKEIEASRIKSEKARANALERHNKGNADAEQEQVGRIAEGSVDGLLTGAHAPASPLPSQGSTNLDDDGDAPERPHVTVTRKMLALMGTTLDDPKWYGSMARVEMWMKQGWSAENLILPAVQKMMMSRTAAPNHISYVEKVIATYAAEISKPIPEIANVTGTRKAPPESKLDRDLRAIGAGHLNGPRPLEPFGDFAGGDIIDQPARSH